MPEAILCPECGAKMAGDGPDELCPRCLMRQVLGEDVSPASGTGPYHGPFVPPDPADLGLHFPQLEILDLLGQGGMGAVYKARQIKLDRLVALKILPPGPGKDPEFAGRFAREAKVLARLNHPHIVSVHDFGQAGGYYYLLMEYVDGVNLRLLLHDGPVSSRNALEIVPQVCDALQYAHEEGVVHRDVKPENILLDRKGRVKIADFGLAKLVGRPPAGFSMTGSNQVMGTLDYMAPEQRHKPQQVDHRADIYSLGVVFYEMLTGELPLGRFDPPSRKAALDARLDDVVFRALEREPDRRYQRISEVKVDVESIVRGAAVGRGPAPAERDHEPPRTIDQKEIEFETVRFQVLGAATGLSLVAFLLLVAAFFIPIFAAAGAFGRVHDEMVAAFFLMFVIGVAASATLWVGASKLRRLESYELPLLASLIAMLPWGPGWVISLPIGLWSFYVLHRSDVKSAIAWNLLRRKKSPRPPERRERPAPPPPPPAPPPPARGGFLSLMRSVHSLMFYSRVEPAPAVPAPRRAEPVAVAEPRPVRAAEQPRKSSRLYWVLGVGALLLAAALALGLVVAASEDGRSPAHRVGRSTPPALFGDAARPPQPPQRTAVPVRAQYLVPAVGMFQSELAQVDRALEAAHAEYRKLEAQHSTWVVKEKTHAEVLISPFPEELGRLEAQLWSDLDASFIRPDGVAKKAKMRNTLQLYPKVNDQGHNVGKPGQPADQVPLFPFGRVAARAELRRESDRTYRWTVSLQSEKSADVWHIESGHAVSLPPELQHLADKVSR